MRAYIVTGTTRGIGRAIAETVVQRKGYLLSLSSAPDKSESHWHNIRCDFRRPESLRGMMSRLLRTVSSDDFSDMVLINNAGVLEPMGPMANFDDNEVLNHLYVNQAAPAILMSAFIRLTSNVNARRRIINISSGAACHPYAGWAMYCASKSAIDMMSLCAAAEQQGTSNPVSICSVYPGKVETDMQKTIRQSDPVRFPAQPLFIKAKAQNELLSPKEVARAIIKLDAASEFKNGCIYDLRLASLQSGDFRIKPIRTLSI